MGGLMNLIRTRHDEGGKLILLITRKTISVHSVIHPSGAVILSYIQQISFWVISVLSTVIIVTLFVISLAKASSGVGSALLGMLGKTSSLSCINGLLPVVGNVFSGIVQQIMTIIFMY